MFLKTLPYVSSSPQIIDRRPNVTFMNRVAPPLKIAAGKNLGYLLVIAELHRKRRIVVSLRLIAPAVRSFEVARENLEIQIIFTVCVGNQLVGPLYRRSRVLELSTDQESST